jgi:hypothetical protein
MATPIRPSIPLRQAISVARQQRERFALEAGGMASALAAPKSRLCGKNVGKRPFLASRRLLNANEKTLHLRGFREMGDTGLEPVTSALSRRRSPS